MEDQGAQITPSRPHHHPYNGGGGTGGGSGGGGREDCWSEGATATLIEAWGDRYLQLSRGNLRQKDWKDVADAVNMRQDGVKPRRTDVQCKNRIDTLKKKYKLEKSKQTPSKWPFYPHLDRLIGANTSATAKKITTTTPSPLLPQPSSSSLLHKSPAVTFTVKNYKEKLNSIQGHNPSPNAAVYSGGSSSKSRMNSQGSSGSSSRGGGDDDGGDDDVLFDGGARKHRMVQDSSDGAAFRELARAVLKFGEIYERIESSKQQQMMELERQRMEVMKDVEYQRMQMFMEAQLDLEKLKRPKYTSSTGKKL